MLFRNRVSRGKSTRSKCWRPWGNYDWARTVGRWSIKIDSLPRGKINLGKGLRIGINQESNWQWKTIHFKPKNVALEDIALVMNRKGVKIKKLYAKEGLSLGGFVVTKPDNLVMSFWGLKMAHQDDLGHIEGHVPGKNKLSGVLLGAILPSKVKNLSILEWSSTKED